MYDAHRILVQRYVSCRFLSIACRMSNVGFHLHTHTHTQTYRQINCIFSLNCVQEINCDCQCQHFDMIAASMRAVLHWFWEWWARWRNDPHLKNHCPLLEGCSQAWQHSLSHQVQKTPIKTATDLSTTNLWSTRGSHREQWLQKVISTMLSIRLSQ